VFAKIALPTATSTQHTHLPTLITFPVSYLADSLITHTSSSTVPQTPQKQPPVHHPCLPPYHCHTALPLYHHLHVILMIIM
jgi:hypothetical protein